MASCRAPSYSSDSSDSSDLPDRRHEARGRTRRRPGAGRFGKTKAGRISKPLPKTKTVKIAEGPKGKDTKGKGRVIKGRTREDSPHPGHFTGSSPGSSSGSFSGSSSGSPSGSSSGSFSGFGDPPVESRVDHLELQLRLQQVELTEHKRLLAEVDQKILDSACRCPDEDNGCKCNQDNAGGVDRAEIDEIKRRLNQTHVLAEDVADAIWDLHDDTMEALEDMHGRLDHTQSLAEEPANAVRDLRENGTSEVETLHRRIDDHEDDEAGQFQDMIQRIDELEGRLRVLETGPPSTPSGLPTPAPGERRPAIDFGLGGGLRPGHGPENPIRSPIASDSRGPSVPSSGGPPPIASDFGWCGVGRLGRLGRGDGPPRIVSRPRRPSVPSSGTPRPIASGSHGPFVPEVWPSICGGLRPPPSASGSHGPSVPEAGPNMPGGPVVPDAGPTRPTCPCEPCDCVQETLPEPPSNDKPPSIKSSSGKANSSDGSTSGESSSSSEEDDTSDMDYLDHSDSGMSGA
ncbi:hypothetical protein PFICI_09171 [Pestalotiopsis fici W106-1]|uniref:Uncharacterized protein n=1 Tax=Pestalotiopsis fici (strain W106-1 / CGMCC3.15140) TaxID=1229662 RepID=W3WZL4_PESFW|nr:uncharacterized protein PFICI_09171 [Pestalotiopsis fici W106-1]ETS79318.1 hypothetical protein PFICI_09171 [Pestalotiopsis fici W106-1]